MINGLKNNIINLDKISKLEKDMHKAAKILDFERAAEIRDKLKEE